MKNVSDIEAAERISRRRARMFPFLGVYFIAGQGIYFTEGQQLSQATTVKLSAWLVWAAILLVALAIAGGRFAGPKVRSLVEDEVTRANRLQAYALGFWTAALSALGVFVLAMFEPVSGREAVHIILTFAVAGALIRFGILERRALKNG
jgi:hypothetical protein